MRTKLLVYAVANYQFNPPENKQPAIALPIVHQQRLERERNTEGKRKGPTRPIRESEVNELKSDAAEFLKRVKH